MRVVKGGKFSEEGGRVVIGVVIVCSCMCFGGE